MLASLTTDAAYSGLILERGLILLGDHGLLSY